MSATITSSNRRNGKPASCEPCRLNKTKCDHGRPTCDRCKQRGIIERCFYHPAPLTRPRRADDDSTSREPRPLKKKRALIPSTAATSVTNQEPASQGDQAFDAVNADVYHPGFLGPGSYAALLAQDEGTDRRQEREISVASERSDRELTHQHVLNKSMRYQMGLEVLSCFRYYDGIRQLIKWYTNENQAGAIPEQFPIDAIDAIEAVVDKHDLRNAPPSPELVLQVLECTSRPFVVSKTLEARDFHILCSGENLRFEMIGFLLAMAGKALAFGFGGHELFPAPGEDREMRPHFIDQLLRASTTCLFLCTMVATVNDITVWMFYENYAFTTMLCGYAGPPSWRRIGELSTNIYTLGIHKESTSADVPLWLRETRRRVYCSSYIQDKAISTFLGRPIRLTKRHADTKPPLDITDEATCGDRSEAEKAVQQLDAEGWNTEGQWRRNSWIRLRYISLSCREEILDFSLSKVDADVERQLLEISKRVHSSWEALPSHLRYWKTCWDEDVPPGVCFMLNIVHTTHWYNEFMIHKLLNYQPLTQNTALLSVSVDILSKVLTLGTLRDRTYDIHRDVLHAIFLFGLPAASVLAQAIREQSRTAQPFPPEISRAEIFRMLSVLISHLDAAAHIENSGARQGEANYNLCRKASKVFTKVIDSVLDAGLPRQGGSESTPSDQMGLDLGLDIFSGPGLDDFGGFEFPGMGLGGDGGADGLDWTAIGQWGF